jgi:hypothetical protein
VTDEQRLIEGFVRSYLAAIEAGVEADEGGRVLKVAFPPGRKRRFGRTRRISFDPAARGDHVEVLEPGSPLLKQIVEDAQQTFGGVGVLQDSGRPEGTVVYTFHLTLFSALRKRVEFLTVTWGPGYDEPFVDHGLPAFVADPLPQGDPSVYDAQAVRQGLEAIQPVVKAAANQFAEPGIREAERLYKENAERVRQYFQNLREEAFGTEARLRKRLGEIQSKLYFTENGLREIKLEKERDKVTAQLRELKQRHSEGDQKLASEEQDQLERQRRRYEPKLSVHLVGVSVLTQRPTPAGTKAA